MQTIHDRRDTLCDWCRRKVATGPRLYRPYRMVKVTKKRVVGIATFHLVLPPAEKTLCDRYLA